MTNVGNWKGKELTGVVIGILGGMAMLFLPIPNHLKAVIWGLDLCFIAIGLFLHRYIDENTTYDDVRRLIPVDDKNLPRLLHTMFWVGMLSIIFSVLLLATFVNSGLPEFESFLMPILGIGGFYAINISSYLNLSLRQKTEESE